jgi:hypothetical protein
MGAYIDGMEDQKLQQWQNNDAIARAKQIALPESN